MAKKVVDPIDIECGICGAKPDQGCVEKRGFTGARLPPAVFHAVRVLDEEAQARVEDPA